MDICIDVNSTLKPTITGIGKFTLSLLKSFCVTFSEEKYRFILYYRKRWSEFRKKPPKLNRKGIIYCNGFKKEYPPADIHVSSSYEFSPHHGKFILILHDLIPLVVEEFSSTDAKEKLVSFLPQRLKRADKVVCISKNTLSDLLKFYPYIKEKTEVIYPALDLVYRKIDNQKIIRKKLRRFGIEDDYLLFVSSIERRKNLISLLKAFLYIIKKFPKVKLVIVGKKVKSYREVDLFMESYEAKNKVVYLGYVNEEDLVYLYNGAKILVYPSFYEGFGFPVVEAFACGVPVVASDVASIREVALGCAELASPYDVESIANGIMNVLSNSNYREKLIIKGLEKAKEFRIYNMGTKYKTLIEGITT
ncbi:MAG: hypothetical protein DRP68_06095 [Candidatus Omnitrophota bacterium]|nr:MAG: hypothetical protein DRP68_06095 [Candidatus Omnitrophota bacterium]